MKPNTQKGVCDGVALMLPLFIMSHIEELQDLYPFENYATFDKVRKLKWCNNTILYAIEYYRVIYKEITNYDVIVKELQDSKMRAVISLLYGALKAANNQTDIMTFGRIYKSDNLKEYIDKVIEGMEAYLPEPEIQDHGRNLDEDWPDTQSEVKKKGLLKRLIGVFGIGLPEQKLAYRLKSLGKQPCVR